MDSSRLRRAGRAVLGVAAALALSAAASRADFITPASVPHPPPAVGPADLTRLPSPADVVRDQYHGLGLRFSVLPFPVAGFAPETAVVRLGGTAAWVPAEWSESVPSRWGFLDYGQDVAGRFVRPRGPAFATASAVTVEVVGPRRFGSVLSAYDSDGRLLRSTATPAGVGPHGGELLTVAAGEISFFDVSPLIPDPPVSGRRAAPAEWGVAGVRFAPADTAPEPCGLALAAAGAAGLAGFTWRRRARGAGRG